MAQKTLSPNTLSGSVKIVSGEIALDGSNPTVVNTGLTTIVGATVTRGDATAPGVDPSAFSYSTSGGTLNIYAWKITGAGDATLIASTNTDVVGYMAVGY